MEFETYTYQYSIPGFHWVGFTLPTATWVSLGWQNDGDAQLLYASQCFVNGTSAYIQLINNSVTSTTIWLKGIYAVTAAGKLALAEPHIKTGTVQKA